MSNGTNRPRPEDLGEGPESRMEQIPQPRPKAHEQEGDRLIQQPGKPKPPQNDATGEGAVEELAQETSGEIVEEQEKRTQRDNPRVTHRDPPPDPRRRLSGT